MIAFHLNRPLRVLKKIFLQKLLNLIEVSIIRPESAVNLIWMILQLLVYSVFLSMVSISIFFSDELFLDSPLSDDIWMKFFNLSFVFSMTVFDFIKELNCAYYECGEVVVDRKKISKNYLKSSRFIYDILACFSLITEILNS